MRPCSALLHQCHDSLAVMIENLQANTAPTDAPALVAAIQAFIRGEAPPSLNDNSSQSFESAEGNEPANSSAMLAPSATDAPRPLRLRTRPRPLMRPSTGT